MASDGWPPCFSSDNFMHRGGMGSGGGLLLLLTCWHGYITGSSRVALHSLKYPRK